MDIGRKLYHGTVLEYFEKLFEKHGCYMHENGKPVQFAPWKQPAIDFAFLRAEQFGGTPAVITTAEGLVALIERKGIIHPCCEKIEDGTFIVQILERTKT